MQYRLYGKTNEQVSALALGCMRFPLKADGEIDEEKAQEMFDYALEHHINYIDTAWPYHGGKSEPLVGKMLKGRRDQVKLATKLPTWLLKKPEDMEYYLQQQLERLQTSYIDFYLVHALNRHTWTTAKELHIEHFLDKILKDGRVRHIGFSFHDSYPIFEEIIHYYDWSFCQIQLNYIDEEYQAGIKGMHLAKRLGLGIAIMEPLRGGHLVHHVPPEVRELFSKAPTKRSAAGWGFDYLWNKPEVNVILSGMSSIDQLKENIALASTSDINCLSEEDQKILTQAQEIFHSKIKVNCTACQYCMPCPFGVNIPGSFQFYNEASLFNRRDQLQKTYQEFYNSKNSPALCTACGACLDKCPQNIAIPQELVHANAYLQK